MSFKLDENIQALFYYELIDKLYIGGSIKNSDEVELHLDENDKKYLKAFTVKIRDKDFDQAKDLASVKATRLANYLTFETSHIVEFRSPRIQMRGENTIGIVMNGLNVTVDFYGDRDVDLTLKSIRFILDSDSLINQQLYHLQNGFRAIRDNDFAMAIKELFLVLENCSTPEKGKYKFLRDRVCHSNLDANKTIDGLKSEFGINIKKGEYLNMYNPKIQKILEQEAKRMLNLTFEFLRSELKKT